ncbi:hypothetical protein E2986_00027 [Frieseomelitta varia]|uniref:Uncharacterized protein n=1 Tax=Frieseomelitta varia TaxID=561572 RepID=A0A833SB03_9HYME|nr:uncharacterized protein LOC122532690 [Frieseomelitta varia]KAF3429857.1 hypothetical protein E2986_00027 [Frieseomelitta varia]
MDPRCNKPRDFVAIYKNLTEQVHKMKRLRTKWLQKYECLLDEHKRLRKEIEKLCEEKQTVIATETFEREEGKTCLPTPITTNGEYGWLASRPKFQLEKYGAYTPQYPDPLKEITPLYGSMPVLAAGIGYIW